MSCFCVWNRPGARSSGGARWPWGDKVELTGTSLQMELGFGFGRVDQGSNHVLTETIGNRADLLECSETKP